MMPITAPLLETYVRCRVLKENFFINRKNPEVGSYAELPLTTAESLAGMGKVEVVETLGDRVSVTAEQLRCPPRDRRAW